MKKTILLVLVACLALALGIFASKTVVTSQQVVEAPTLVSGTLLQPGKPLTDFELLDQNGEKFTLEHLKGQWDIVFFGFLNCPDICPATMQLLKNIKSDLQGKNAWQNKRVVFVSVDPARDTVEKIKPYIDYFDKEFVGLTGTNEQVQAFAKQLSIPYMVEPKNEFGGYNVAHSGSILLINSAAELAGILSAPHDHTKITYDLLGDYFTTL